MAYYIPMLKSSLMIKCVGRHRLRRKRTVNNAIFVLIEIWILPDLPDDKTTILFHIYHTIVCKSYTYRYISCLRHNYVLLCVIWTYIQPNMLWSGCFHTNLTRLCVNQILIKTIKYVLLKISAVNQPSSLSLGTEILHTPLYPKQE